MLRKLDLFPSSGEVKETPTQMGPLELTLITLHKQSKRFSFSHLTRETHPFSETLCFLVI
jgi:hypothetical protein